MTDRDFTVSSKPDPSGATVLSVAGELDHHTSPRFSRALAETRFGPEAPVVIDLSELIYCDSTGITVLVTAYHRAHATGARLLIAGMSADLMRVFRTVGLDRVFTFEPTVEEALKAGQS